MSDQHTSANTAPFPFPTSSTAPDAAAGARPADAGASGEHPPAAPPFPFPKSSPEPDAGQPEELSEEELRLMADTMPGDGPGDD